VYQVNIVIDQVIDAIATFFTPFAQGAQIVRGNVNRVPMPGSPVIYLTELFSDDLSVPYIQFDADAELNNLNSSLKLDVQVDFYGEIAAELCHAFRAAWRSPYSFDNFPENIKPLYCSQAMQHPLITGEKQYLNRFTTTAVLQYNTIIQLPQESALEVVPNLIQADK